MHVLRAMRISYIVQLGMVRGNRIEVLEGVHMQWIILYMN